MASLSLSRQSLTELALVLAERITALEAKLAMPSPGEVVRIDGDDEGIKELVEELSRALFATLHANGFDYVNTAQALIDNGWRKVMVTENA